MNRYRPTWASINLNNLSYNLKEAQKHAKDKIVIPVIKANAYGHGAKEVFRHLLNEGISFFAVSLLEEALELRALNLDAEILILGPILKEDLEVASINNIQITIYNNEILNDVLSSKHPLKVHVKVDTGMSRYGLKEPLQVIQAVNDLQQKEHIDVIGIYTHFATANEDEAFYHMQLSQMKLILDQIKIKPPMIHISNSSSIFKYEKDFDFTTHVRLGISLYGLSLDDPKPNLKPVMSLHTKVVEIKTLKPGDSVGYGATYQAHTNEKIAILPIGYADGWIRKNKTGQVQIHDKLYPIIGIICMDACFIKIDDEIKLNDEVILFGDLISIDDIAKRLETINYEVTCQISSRVPRVYKGGNV